MLHNFPDKESFIISGLQQAREFITKIGNEIENLQNENIHYVESVTHLNLKIDRLNLRMDELILKIDELNRKTKTKQQIFDEEFLNAAEQGNVEKINSTLDHLNVNIKTKNEKGQTALHLSVINNHQDMADFILTKEPALFMTIDNVGYTPLQHIAHTGQLEMLDWLYKKGKDIPGFSDNQEEFDKIYTVATEDAKLFLANKKLLESAKTEKIEGVKDALEKGASIDIKANDGETALHKAVYSKYINITHLLLEQGADPTIRNNNHETVLDFAKITKDKYLISVIATSFLICAADHGTCADILIALNAGANLIGKDRNGQTALHRATLAGDMEKIKFLLKKHAEAKLDINIITDKDGNTPYKLADKSGYTVETTTVEKDLDIYMAEKIGSYRKDVKFLENQIKLSNSPLSFVAAVGQGEKNKPSALNTIQTLHPNSDQSENVRPNYRV